MTGPEVQVAASTSSLPSAVLLQLLEKEKEKDKEEQPSSLRGVAYRSINLADAPMYRVMHL